MTEVKRRVNACKSFLELELDARIVAATMSLLGISDIDASPKDDVLPLTLDDVSCKRQFIEMLSGNVVDKFILRSDQVNRFLEQRRKTELEQEEAAGSFTSDGRYKCRWPDCNKTYAVNGKCKLDHEFKAHGLEAQIEFTSDSDCTKSPTSDDMYNYQCAFMEFAMIIRNFHDAISEGDGLRIVRSWKFILPYLKADGSSSRKYALEGFHFLSQVLSLLSPRDAHRLIWNRSVKNKLGPGGNIPLDLALEHYIRLLKLIFRKLGANATNKNIVDRYSKALAFNKQLMDNFDNTSAVIRRSGKHVKKAAKCDLEKTVSELATQQAFTYVRGRKYGHFRDTKDTLLFDFCLRTLYGWINDHKKQIHLQKTAQ